MTYIQQHSTLIGAALGVSILLLAIFKPALWAACRYIRALWPSLDRQDFFTVVGLGLLHRGAYMVYPPAAYILGGVFALTFVIFLERERSAAKTEDTGPQLVSRGRQ